MAGRRCDKCGETEHHAPDCTEMFFGGDRTKPRGVIHPLAAVRQSGRPISDPIAPRPGPTPPHYDSPLAVELKDIFGAIKVRPPDANT